MTVRQGSGWIFFPYDWFIADGGRWLDDFWEETTRTIRARRRHLYRNARQLEGEHGPIIQEEMTDEPRISGSVEGQVLKFTYQDGTVAEYVIDREENVGAWTQDQIVAP